MTTVALVGADGAGKSSVARRLEERQDLPVKAIYMGANPEAVTHALPTTRLAAKLKRWLGREPRAGGPPAPRAPQPAPRSRLGRAARSLKSLLRLANQVGEEWLRQSLAWYYQRRGYIVVFDRHAFADYHAHEIRGSPEGLHWTRRIHGLLLEKLYPRPDVVILLDAPAPVLFARKREGTVERLESRRQEYFELEGLVPAFRVVCADRPLEAVVREVAGIIRDHRPRAR